MGTSYSARVIVGFDVEVRPRYKEVTKYHEETGVPYLTSKRVGDAHFIEDKQLDLGEIREGNQYEGLEFDSIEDDGELTSGFLGVVVKDVDQYNRHAGFEQFDTTVPDAVLAFARKYDVQPKWFVQLHVC